MANVLMIIRKSNAIEMIQELIDQIEENNLLIRIISDTEFDEYIDDKRKL